MTPDNFTCANCGATYEKGWSDEESLAEHDKNFPGMSHDTTVVVCDDCYQKMMASDYSPKEFMKQVEASFVPPYFEDLGEENDRLIEEWEKGGRKGPLPLTPENFAKIITEDPHAPARRAKLTGAFK